jgi:2-C-methyl-D-erythritol 4-phosphate cytidylyltransferase
VSRSFIITAGGIGKRMGSHLPKQFIEIAGKPILLHTLEKFYAFDASAQLILTLPNEWIPFWKDMLTSHECTIPHQLVDGGLERYHSIKNALTICTGDVIAVHDGVRPLVNNTTIERCLTALQTFEAAIPVIPLKESLRAISHHDSKAVNRADYCLVQTPQCFRASVLNKAYDQPFHAGITDDASLVEEAGFAVHLVDGNEENLKITSPNDLFVAEAYLNRDKNIA